MNNNGKDERTIEPCPMPGCGGECWCEADDIDDKMQDCSPYWIRCKRCDYQYGHGIEPLAIAAHNELRRRVSGFDEAIEKAKWADDHAGQFAADQKRMEDLTDERDEVVRLLRRAKNRISIAHEVRMAIDEYLARIDKGGGK